MSWKHLVLLFVIVVIVWLGACSNGNQVGNTESTNTENNERINDTTPTMNENKSFTENASVTENDVLSEAKEEPTIIQVAYPFGEEGFYQRFDPVNESLPHIEVEYVAYDNTSERLQELFANDILPDIIMQYNDMRPVYELDVIHPIEDLADEHNFDISSLHPSLVAAIRSLDNEDRLIGLPDGTSHLALYYNKDIFDMFGVSYPDPLESMTWEEAFELSRQLTGELDGEEYVGFEFAYNNVRAGTRHMQRQLGINATDPETGEILILEQAEFQRIFDLNSIFFNIPGVYDPDTIYASKFIEGNAAMSVASNMYINDGWADPNHVDHINMAPLPTMEEAPNTGPYLGSTPMIIANYSDNKNEAFEVLEQYVSPENHIPAVRSGSSASVLSDPEIIQQFGADSPFYENMNRDAWFALEPAVVEGRLSRWDVYVDFDSALQKIAEDGMDVNTAMRELTEESETTIEEIKAAEGN